MTDRDVVERIGRMLGVAVAATRRHEKNKKWKPSFRFSFRGAKAIALMRELRPYMGLRRQGQIDAAIASYTPRQAGDNTRKLTPALVRRIRRSTEPSEKLGAKLGISGNGIRKIRRGEIWKAVA
jgi:hypothetical protein